MGTVNPYTRSSARTATLGRDNKSECFSSAGYGRRSSAQPRNACRSVDQAVAEITKPRGALHYAGRTRGLFAPSDRVEVQVRQHDGTTLPERLSVIDWIPSITPSGPQLWVHSDLYTGRTDLVVSLTAFRWCSSSSKPHSTI